MPYMPTYVSLLNFTDQGIRTVKDTLERTERAAGVTQKHGARLVQNYWTVGPYDAVVVLEAPGDESLTTFLLETGSWGTSGPPRFGHTIARRCQESLRDL